MTNIYEESGDMKVFFGDGRDFAEIILPTQYYIDSDDGMEDMFEVHYISKEELKELTTACDSFEDVADCMFDVEPTVIRRSDGELFNELEHEYISGDMIPCNDVVEAIKLIASALL